MPEIIEKPAIVPNLLSAIQELPEAEKQVIVHCGFKNNFMRGNLIRIWRSTYLLDNNSSHKSKLLFTDKIVYHPLWMEVPPVEVYWFTLIFSGLPKECTSFDFAEIIPEDDGFFVRSIPRTQTDVYRINL